MAAAGAVNPDSALLILPNRQGVLDAAAIAQAEIPEALPNPFRIRWHPPQTVRDWQLILSGVLVGATPDKTSVCLNGGLYGLGDQYEGWTIATISADRIELRKDHLRLQVPVQDTPVTIRLAP